MFNESERKIFEYNNGERIVKGDPLALQRNFLKAIKGEGRSPEAIFNILGSQDVQMDDPQLNLALDALIPVVRSTFNVKEVDAGGLTELETINLLSDFLTYMEGLKKNTENSQNGSQPTETQDDPSITSPSLDSGKIENEPEIS